MTSADLFHQAAERHLAAGQWAAARDLALFGLRADPHHGRLHEAVGVAEYELEEFAAALFHLEAATAAVPLGVEPQLALADLYARFGQTQSAGVVVRFLAEADRCPVPLLPRLAKLLGRCGEDELALGVCQRLTLLRPTFHPAWYGAAFYLDRLGRPAGEIAFPLREAFALAPHLLLYRISLAGALADTGREGEAYRLLAEVPPAAVRCGCQCRRFARVCELAGDAERADTYRRRADRLPPLLDDPPD
jgi:tetratricopeptide (TPR) repeat protein